MRTEVRRAAVAGVFYPDDAVRLAHDVDAMLEAAEPRGTAVPKVIVAPHAGYVYSGPIAASAFAAAARARVGRVVLIGPSHRVAFHGVAAPSASKLETPLGLVEVDVEALDAAGVARNDLAHAREHSLEVELPFVQRVFGAKVRVCPIVCGRATTEEVASVVRALWGGPETLVVVSTDLSHYLPYEKARTIDERTAEKIVALDDDLEGDEACGYVGLRGVLAVAREKGLKGRLLDLRSSGDTAGSRDEVVGYGAFALEQPS